MGTRSLIGKDQGDGTSKVIYVHFDGYVEGGVGDTLKFFYGDENVISKMIEMGDRTSLSENSENDKLYKEGPSVQKNNNWRYSGQEFEYFWKDGKWHYREVSWSHFVDGENISNTPWIVL